MSRLPKPTPVEGAVRFFQAQDQPIVTTHVRVGNRVFSHAMDVVSKMRIHIIYGHFSPAQYQKRCFIKVNSLQCFPPQHTSLKLHSMTL